MAVWEAPGSHCGCLGSSWESFWLSGKAPRSHFGCLGSSWESFWLSGKLLEVILANWEAPGSHFGCLGELLGATLAVWEAPVSHFGCLGSSWWSRCGSLLGANCREQAIRNQSPFQLFLERFSSAWGVILGSQSSRTHH